MGNRHFAHVNVQDLFTASDIGKCDVDLAVKTTRAQQRRIQNIGAVGRSNHNHAHIGFKAVHLDQHLVQGLLTLIVTTAQPRAPLATDCVDLINKNNAGCVFLGVVKHVANPRSANAHEHLYKIRTGNTEKRNLGFSSDRFGQQGFTRTRGAH